MNLYEYCSDNPVSGIDPSGHQGVNLGGYEFSFGGIGLGLATGWNGMLQGLSWGHLGSHEYDDLLGHDFAVGGGAVARESLMAAALGGAGKAFSAIRAASAAEVTMGGVGAAETAIRSQVMAKMAYGLGEATGNLHNIERSTGMYKSLISIGLNNNPATRQYIADTFVNALRNPATFVKMQANGRAIREFMLFGPNGALRVESVWKAGHLITYKFFHGG